MVKTFQVSRTSRHAHRTVGLALQAAALKRKPARIEIAPGRYEEPLRVNGDVELVAADGPGTVRTRGSRTARSTACWPAARG